VRIFTTIQQRLNEPTSGIGLVVFRILFGFLMVFEALFVFLPWTRMILSPKHFHLNYPAFSFVGPLPAPWYIVEPVILAVVAMGMAIGYRFRLCAVLFTIIFAHLFFIDQLVFNNHLYLYILMGGLLAATPAAAFWSVDSYKKRGGIGYGASTETGKLVPKWSVYLLQFQLLILYVFGGIAKLNGDWLQGEPVRYWASLLQEQVWLGELLIKEWSVWGISYGGLFFDLLVGFFLLHRKTFLPAACAAIAFHVTNSQLFLIGSFPVFGILSLVLFLPSDMAQSIEAKVKGWLTKSREGAAEVSTGSVLLPGKINRAGIALVAIYALFQILLPMRPWFLPGNPSWTDSSNTFAWRMMLNEKDATTNFIVSSEARDLLLKYPQLQLTSDQSENVSKDPDLIYQYANWLSSIFKAMGMKDTSVRVRAVCSLNGRPFQPMIDPSVDLTKAENPLLGTADWILPLDPNLPIGGYAKTDQKRQEWVQQALQAGIFAASSSNMSGGTSSLSSAVKAMPEDPSAVAEK
jgi:vitamin K-dependent gamma-carboxylase